MKCAWEEYLKLLSPNVRDLVDKQGQNSLQELRLRIGQPIEMAVKNRSVFLPQNATTEDIQYCINVASRYSPWSVSTSSEGYITVAGGHRIGLCGTLIIDHGQVIGFKLITSLCIRVARDIFGIAKDLVSLKESILIIGAPGTGKTTLLRDLIRQLANDRETVSVVDEKGEIFPTIQDKQCFQQGKRMDVLTGSNKKHGIEILLRNMNPTVIAVDEITAEEDCNALIHAGRCGIRLLATAHAHDEVDLVKRPIYRTLLESGLFENIIIMHQDKTWSKGRFPIL